ncbi:MAG: lipid A deacylase LpxR family protein [Magnetospirillum sp.]|nr:lipid A deacylase LpxR family protein [Magnetospirillum sp.]
MKSIRFLVFGIACAFAAPAAGRDATPVWDWRGTYSILVENDKFNSWDQAKQTDRNFTNGLRINWMSEPGLRWEPLKALAAWVPVFDASGKTRAGLALGQNIYTPEDISRRDLVRTDRPYSGWTYLAAALTSDLGGEGKGRLDTLELQLGLVGPQSFAEQTQKEWHKLIGARPPLGWNNQLRNEPGVALFYERKWRRQETPIARIGWLEIDATPHIGGSVGNVFTYAAAGATFRIGNDLSVDYGPPRIRPGLAGSMHIDPPGDGFAYYAFFGFEGRAVARDITLDGNTLARSHSVDRRPLVGDLQMGVAALVGPMRGTFSYVMRTREFDGQRSPDRFGALSISYRY